MENRTTLTSSESLSLLRIVIKKRRLSGFWTEAREAEGAEGECATPTVTEGAVPPATLVRCFRVLLILFSSLLPEHKAVK